MIEDSIHVPLKIHISNEKFESIKKQVLDQDTIRRVNVDLSEIEVESLKLIRIKGNTFKLTHNAVAGLGEALGISSVFMNTIKKAYNDNQAILNIIIKAIKKNEVKSITLVYNRKLNEVTNIYPKDSKLISDAQYFEVLEKVINKTPGAYLRNLIQSVNGDISAVIANPKLEFQFGNMVDEIFTSGMTLDLTAHEMWTSFFTERLSCINGMTTRDQLCTVSVQTHEKVPNFMSAILDSEYHLNSIAAFRNRLNRCYHTTASLQEVLNTESSVRTALGSKAEILMQNLSSHRLKMTFGEKYLANKDIHKFLKTDITLWELVNEITAISSRIEQHKINIPDKTNLKLQKIGGDRMFKIPDLAPNTIKQLY